MLVIILNFKLVNGYKRPWVKVNFIACCYDLTYRLQMRSIWLQMFDRDLQCVQAADMLTFKLYYWLYLICSVVTEASAVLFLTCFIKPGYTFRICYGGILVCLYTFELFDIFVLCIFDCQSQRRKISHLQSCFSFCLTAQLQNMSIRSLINLVQMICKELSN